MKKAILILVVAVAGAAIAVSCTQDSVIEPAVELNASENDDDGGEEIDYCDECEDGFQRCYDVYGNLLGSYRC